jgi:hypothetical protein
LDFGLREFPVFSCWMRQLCFSINLIIHITACIVLLLLGIFNHNHALFLAVLGGDLVFGVFPSWLMWKLYRGFPMKWSLNYGIDLFWNEYEAREERKAKEVEEQQISTGFKKLFI